VKTTDNRVFLLNTNLPPPACDGDFERYYLSIGTNNGNAYIAYAVAKLFGLDFRPGTTLNNIWTDPLRDEQIERINTEFSHAFVILQDHLREDFAGLPFAAIARSIERIRVPLVVWSLGANSFNGFDMSLVDRLRPDQVRFFKVLAERALSIGIRGEYTAAVLDRLGIHNHEIVGCPSYFETGSGRLVTKKDALPQGYRIVALGSLAKEDADRLEYVYQSERFGMKLLHFPDAPLDERDLRELQAMSPLGRRSLLKAHRDGRARYFNRVEAWKAFLREPDLLFAMGSRVHGAIAALNVGLPALVTSGDGRARETCAYLGIPFEPRYGHPHRAFEADLVSLYDRIDVDAVNRRYGQVYGTFEAWLRNMGVPHSFDGAEARSDIAGHDLPGAAGRTSPDPRQEHLERLARSLRGDGEAGGSTHHDRPMESGSMLGRFSRGVGDVVSSIRRRLSRKWRHIRHGGRTEPATSASEGMSVFVLPEPAAHDAGLAGSRADSRPSRRRAA